MPLIDGLLNSGTGLYSGTATTGSSTGTSVISTVNGGPIQGYKIRVLMNSATVATAGTVTTTYQAFVLLAPTPGTAWRTAVLSDVITATTAVRHHQRDLLVKVTAFEPYMKVGIVGATATGATSPQCMFRFDLVRGFSNEMYT
jgi:hypothetical protein